MGIQVAIRGEDDDSDTGLSKLHGPTRPKGQGHSPYPYLSFPHSRRPWEGSVSEGLMAFAKWLHDKPALERRSDSIRVYAVRSPEEVRGRRAKRDARRFLNQS